MRSRCPIRNWLQEISFEMIVYILKIVTDIKFQALEFDTLEKMKWKVVFTSPFQNKYVIMESTQKLDIWIMYDL